MKINQLPSRAYLQSRFTYDPDSGKLLWNKVEEVNYRQRQWNTRYAGTEAGTVKTKATGHKYLQVSINKKLVPVHRVIWKMVTGLEPTEVDHLNQNGTDNRWNNLRNVPHALNMRNLPKKKSNKSGATGVHFDKRRQCYYARISYNSKMLHVGTYQTLEAAAEAVKARRIELGFTENHGE